MTVQANEVPLQSAATETPDTAPLSTTAAGAALASGMAGEVRPNVPMPYSGQGPIDPNAPIPAPEIGPAPGSFASRFASALNMFSTHPDAPDALNAPGGFAKMMIGAAVHAMTPGGAISNALGDAAAATAPVPRGGGALTGITRTLAAGNQRVAAEKQQEFENQRKIHEEQQRKEQFDLEKRRTQAQIASANSEEYLRAKMSRNADLDFRKNTLEVAKESAQPLIDAGAPVVAQKLNSDQLHDRLKADGEVAAKEFYFQDGWEPVPGAKDKNGDQQFRETWTILGPSANGGMVHITPDQAKKWNTLGILEGNVPLNEEKGQDVPAGDYYKLSKDYQSRHAADLQIQEVQAKIAASQSETERNKADTREKNLTIQEKKQKNDATSVFMPYLAAANGDAILAYNELSDKARAGDPQAKKDLTSTQMLFGPGNLEKYRNEEVAGLTKTIEDGEKTLAQRAMPGAVALPPDEDIALKDDIAGAKAKRNQYLGFHPAAPPVLGGIVTNPDFKKLTPEQQSQQILGSKINDVDKFRLLHNLGLSVPQYLIDSVNKIRAAQQNQPTPNQSSSVQ